MTASSFILQTVALKWETLKYNNCFKSNIHCFSCIVKRKTDTTKTKAQKQSVKQGFHLKCAPMEVYQHL